MKSLSTVSVFPSPEDQTLLEQEAAAFARETLGHVHVTDVGDKPRDFDAAETERAGHLQLDGFRGYGVDDYHGLKYAAYFLNGWPGLVDDTIKRSVEEAQRRGYQISPQVLRAQHDIETKVLRAVLNAAPRNEAVAENVNGKPFYVILTRSGVELHCTPAEAAAYIGPDIEAIFVSPTDTNPLFNPDEQFRSRTTGLTAHVAPDNLRLVWRRGEHSVEQLHALIKPPQVDEVGYIDRPFHNRRIITPDIEATWDQINSQQSYDGTIRVQVGTSVVRAQISTSLRSIPEGKWGIYRNPADVPQESGHIAAYELTRRYDEGKNWFDKGQNPDAYLKADDRRIGVPVTILPKNEARERVRLFLCRAGLSVNA